MSAQSYILISGICMVSGFVLLLAAAIMWFAGHIGRVISELKGKKIKRYEKLKVIEDLMIVNSKERIDY